MRIIAIVSYVKIYILFPVSFTFASVSGGLFRAFILYVMRLCCCVCCIRHVCFEARAICLYVGAIVTEATSRPARRVGICDVSDLQRPVTE